MKKPIWFLIVEDDETVRRTLRQQRGKPVAARSPGRTDLMRFQKRRLAGAGYPVRPASDATTMSSSPRSTGFETWAWKPAIIARVRSSRRA